MRQQIILTTNTKGLNLGSEVITLSALLWYGKLEREKRKTLRMTTRVIWLLLCSIFGKEVSDSMKF